MKISAIVPSEWEQHFTHRENIKGGWRWQDKNTDRIVLRSPDPQPWGKPFTVLIAADFGETRSGRRYEKRGKIVLYLPESDSISSRLSTIEREFRIGKVFQCDRALIPSLIYSDGNFQVIYWVAI